MTSSFNANHGNTSSLAEPLTIESLQRQVFCYGTFTNGALDDSAFKTALLTTLHASPTVTMGLSMTTLLKQWIRRRSHYGRNDGNGDGDVMFSRSHYEKLNVTMTMSLP